ncbi:hypothetical protein J5X84_15075 [Streptosporangiaceae bacterium NEAU-GS5]|nr:hypothetical protein [Streptosporangiaceae bacterium NEAU-GS5]
MADNNYVIPKGMLITEGGSSRRLFLEQQKLQKYFPQFGFTKSRDGSLAVSGSLRTNSGYVYALRIELGEHYPHQIPHIRPVGWNSTCPHVYESGALCIMRPDQWRSIFSIAFVVAKSAIWLNKFEVYRQRGYWPGNAQPH